MEHNIKASWAFEGTRFTHWPSEQQKSNELVSGMSIIVCTYQRAASLRRFLSSCALQKKNLTTLIIVDASSDDETEITVKSRGDLDRVAHQVVYHRVEGQLKGLTRQRNFGLRWVYTDLIAFFDDDIVLDRHCLAELEATLRSPQHSSAIAACCQISNESMKTLPPRWRIRRFLRLYRQEQAGYYHSCGIAIPQSLLPLFSSVREVEIVPGGATCWRTKVFRRLAFDETFEGYGQAEDIEFSLKSRMLGPKLLVAGARVDHLHAANGRPSAFHYGYQCARHSLVIRRRYGSSQLKHCAQYLCWQAIDLVLLLAQGFAQPRAWMQAAGRITGFVNELLRAKR